MSTIVTAVYEKGLLRPLQPLRLLEHQTVQLQILAEEVVSDVQHILAKLVADGLITPPPGKSDIEPLSEAERTALAETLGQATAKPLSEVIIEERGEW